ncbi:hypothetical protein Tco_0445679 [Tanacetum coccineum]
MYYQIIRADGSLKNYKVFSEMLDDFDRKDVMDLYRLVQESWRLFDSCGIHMLLMHTGIAIHMMIEKKYPLTQEMLSRMLSRRLEVDQESEMAFELLSYNWQYKPVSTARRMLVLLDQQIQRIHQLDTTYQPFHSEQRSVTTWDDLVEKFVQKFYQLFDHNEEIKEDDDPHDITNIFKIEGNLFDFETPLCESFNDFNYLLKIDKDLFTFDFQGTGTYEEYELNNPVTRDLEEPWLDNGVPYQLYHKWYDELADGRLKEETLMYKTKVEESWGNATPGVMKFYAWLIDSFGNFYELDYNVLVKLQEFEKAHDPYLEVNNIFCRNYDTSNAQDNQGHKERMDDPTLEPSICKIRRFEMMKYSFNADKEYIAIKESEYLNH